MTIHKKAVKHYFTVMPFVFQFYPVCYFGKFINFGFGTEKHITDTLIYVAHFVIKKTYFLFLFLSNRDRLTEDDCIGTTSLSLQSISGQGDEGWKIL